MIRKWLSWIWVGLIAVVLGVQFFSARLSCIYHGHWRAKIVPTSKLNVFDYVSIDFMRAGAIVFEDDKAIGWTFVTWTSPPIFVPFVKKDFVVTESAEREATWWSVVQQLAFMGVVILPFIWMLVALRDWLQKRWRKTNPN